MSKNNSDKLTYLSPKFQRILILFFYYLYYIITFQYLVRTHLFTQRFNYKNLAFYSKFTKICIKTSKCSNDSFVSFELFVEKHL
jgi:hypothetical protein